nr:hypothetical protein [Tanacetum cinerariifolium]
MAVVEVPQTLEYRGGQLNVAPVPEVENFTNWKKSPDDEEDTRGSHEYLNDIEEEYQERALLAKSKIFFKKCTKRFNSAKATDQTEFHKCGKEKHKPELRPTKDFEAKYDKVKAKLALLSSSASASKAAIVKSKDPTSFGQKDLVFVKSLADDTKLSIPGVERPWLSKAEGFMPNHDTGRILPTEPQRNTTDPLVVFNDSSATKYDSTDKSSVSITPLPPLKKLDGVEPISEPKTIKSIIRTCDHAEYISTKNMSHHLKSLGRSSRPKNPRPSKHFFPPCIQCGFNDQLSNYCVNYPICEICGSYNLDTHGYNKIIYLRRGIKSKNPQHIMKSYETCGSTFHTTIDQNDIEFFKRGEELQAKKAKALKSSKAESLNANRSKTPTKRWVSKEN